MDEKSTVILEISAKGFASATNALTKINTSMDKLDKAITKLAKNSGMAAVDKLTNKLAKQQAVIEGLRATQKRSTQSQILENKKLEKSLQAITKENNKLTRSQSSTNEKMIKKISTETANRKVAENKLKDAIKESNKVQKEQLKTMKAENKVVKESLKGIEGRLRSLERLNKTQLQYEATIKKLKQELSELKGEEVQFVSNTDRLNAAIKQANSTIIKHKGLIAHVTSANKASKAVMRDSTVIVKSQQEAIDRLNVAIKKTTDVSEKNILVTKRKAMEEEKLAMQTSASLVIQKMQRDSMMRLKTTMNTLTGGMRTAGRVLTRTLTPAMMAAVAAGVKMAAGIESQIVRFSILTGSMEKGAKLYKQIVEFSAVTPFQLPDLDKTVQILLAFGSPLEAVMNELRMLGDIAMGDSEKLERIASSFGKVRSRGTAHMRELNRFIMAGVPIFQELRKNIGGTGEDLFEMVRQNKISFEQVNQAVVTLTASGGRFHDMTLRTSRTLEGRFSTALDNLKLNLASVFEVFTDDLKSMLEGFIDWSQGFRLLSEGTRESIAKLVVGLAAVGPALTILAGGIKVVTSAYIALKLAQTAFNPVLAIFIAVAAAATAIYVAYKKLKGQLDEAGDKAKKLAEYTERMNDAQDYSQTNMPLMNKGLFETAKAYGLQAEAIGRVLQAEELLAELRAGFKASDAFSVASKQYRSMIDDGRTNTFSRINDTIKPILKGIGFGKSSEADYDALNKAFKELADINEVYKKRVIELIGGDLKGDSKEIGALIEAGFDKNFSVLFSGGLKVPNKEEFMAQSEENWRNLLLETASKLTSERELRIDSGLSVASPLETFLEGVNSASMSSMGDNELATTSTIINKLQENRNKVKMLYSNFKEDIEQEREEVEDKLIKNEINFNTFEGSQASLDKKASTALEVYETSLDNFDTDLIGLMQNRVFEIKDETGYEGAILQLLGISDDKDVIKTLEAQLDLISTEMAGLDYSFADIEDMLLTGKIPDVVQVLVDASTEIGERLAVQLAHKDRISLFTTFFEGDLATTEIDKLERQIKVAISDLAIKLAESADLGTLVTGDESLIDVIFGHMKAGTLEGFIGEADKATQDAYALVVSFSDKIKKLTEDAGDNKSLIEALLGDKDSLTTYFDSIKIGNMKKDFEKTFNAFIEKTKFNPDSTAHQLQYLAEVEAKTGDITSALDGMSKGSAKAWIEFYVGYKQLKEFIDNSLGVPEDQTSLIEALIGSPKSFDEYIENLEIEGMYSKIQEKMRKLTENSGTSMIDFAGMFDMDALGEIDDFIDLDTIFDAFAALPESIKKSKPELIKLIELMRILKGLLPEIEDEEVKLKDTLMGLAESFQKVLEGSILPAFEQLGTSIGEGASGIDAWGSALQTVSDAIMKAMPQLMLQAGLSLLSSEDSTTKWIGVGLIAGSGLVSFLGGLTSAESKVESSTTPSEISYSASGDTFNKGYLADSAMMRSSGYGVSVIGEAGTEAVMPLTRGSSGKLGIAGGGGGNVYVNVVNNTSAKVTKEVKENSDGTKTLNFLIHETVKQGMASGEYDRPMQKVYGSTRRGR